MSTFDELRRRTQAMTQSIADFTGVNYSLVGNIIHYARRLTQPDYPDVIDELVFVSQLGGRFGITSRFYIQLIFESLKIRKTKHIRLEDYVRMVCIFHSNNLNVKVDFVFKVYDFQGDGFINHGEMYKLLESSIVVQSDDDPSVQVKELIDIVISVVDTNNDGRISLEEFRRYVGRDVLCLELFGQVLPLKGVMDRFIALLENKSPSAVREFFVNERAISLNEPTLKRKKDPLFRVSLEMP